MNDLSMHILDILQNSIRAESSMTELEVHEYIERNLLTIIIRDNGKGMSQEQVERLTDPFFTSRTTRRVGMGIPLLKQSAEQSGGSLSVVSSLGVGTTVTATFIYDHIDRPPLGDVANAFVLSASANPQIDFILRYGVDDREYELSTIDIKEALEGVPINDASVIRMITDMIKSNIDDLS